MIRPVLISLALGVLLPGAALAQQSFMSRLLSNTGQAVANQLTHGTATSTTANSGSDGLHAKSQGYNQWAYPNYAPDTMDGYTHLRFGSAALDPFGNTVGGRQVCDREFVGYALLHRTELLPQDAQRCLSLEQANDPSATMATMQQRMTTISNTRRFYIRGAIRVDTRVDPAGQTLPPGKGVVILGGGLPIIASPNDVDFRLGGPNWLQPGWRPGYIGNQFALLFNADPSLGSRWQQMADNAYVFFTVSEPKHPRASTWQRGHTMYDVEIEIDKIILTDNQNKIVLTPPSGSAPQGATP